MSSAFILAFCVLVAAGVVAAIVYLSGRRLRDRNSDAPPGAADENNFGLTLAHLGGGPEPFERTGKLPMSVAIKGSFVRWHDPEYFWTGEEFWKSFQDGPWKWNDQQRYAGKSLNCGHYFALDRTGAVAEAGFYDLDQTKYRLLTVEAAFDPVLDLTHEDNLVAVGREVIENFDELPDRSRLMHLLSFLMDRAKGGNGFTDQVGRWARSQGYDGILFFGARAIEKYPDLVWQIEHGQDYGMAGPLVHGDFVDMRAKPDLKNLVIFSGAKLMTLIASYDMSPGAKADNVFHNVAADEFDRRLEFGAAYQDERSRIIVVGGGIRIV